jgi:preprotein translocase subunit SecA
MKNLIYEIKIENTNLRQKSDEELEGKITQLKKRAKIEALDKLVVEWFALVQEVSFRKIGLRHFDTQLLAGLFLHQGKIVEMKTGEGKTLASTLPVALNALKEKGVHVVTVNDYLAERDQKFMGKVYKGLGLTVGLVKSTSTLSEKRTSYNSDITYVTNSELVFDYLRDSSAYNLNELVQRPFNYCVIDEIDSILIDEARTPLILSTSKKAGNINKLYLAKAVANSLTKDLDFELDEKRREINLTESGYEKTKAKLGKKTLYDLEDPWMLEILNALKAKYIFKLNKDYIVLKNKVLIVDEFSGRIMEDRRWSLGIHEAIEIKECVTLGGETQTKSSITYQNFFTLYPKLAGMTGTAKTTEKEFQDIYNLEVLVLATEKPLIRKDLPDLVYQTELSKWKAVLSESKQCFEKGQPVLIGTASVEKSEFLSELFTLSKIPHQILNAKPENVTRESEIIAQAGERSAITIATNMAGRGTDIILGGNTVFKVKQKLSDLLLKRNQVLKKEKSTFLEPEGSRNIDQQKQEQKQEQELEVFVSNTYKDYEDQKSLPRLEEEINNLPYSLETSLETLRVFYTYLYNKVYAEWEKENKIVKELGGLFVLGTERHETRRIDNQLRGRAGRQGDPGNSQFFISLEDELIKVFGGDSIRRWVDYLTTDKESPLESDLLTKSLEKAQQKVELYNYDLRKNVFQYDDILNTQRKQLFQARKQMLSKNIYQELFLRYAECSLDEEILAFKKSLKENFFSKFEKQFNSYSSYFAIKKRNTFLTLKSKTCSHFYSEIWISNDLRFAESNFYQLGFLKSTRATSLLSIIDFYWTEHLERMSYIRETINWRSYGQQTPLVEYNMEASKSFKLMLEQIRSCMIYYFLSNPIN